jgi:hypothetical protein
VPVAPRRKTQERQDAEESAELMNGASFKEHQRTGGRAKRLSGKGHLISFSSRPLGLRRPANGPMATQKTVESVATQQSHQKS